MLDKVEKLKRSPPYDQKNDDNFNEDESQKNEKRASSAFLVVHIVQTQFGWRRCTFSVLNIRGTTSISNGEGALAPYTSSTISKYTFWLMLAIKLFLCFFLLQHYFLEIFILYKRRQRHIKKSNNKTHLKNDHMSEPLQSLNLKFMACMNFRVDMEPL